MATPEAEFQRAPDTGPGAGDQLPFGEATELNEGLDVAEALQEETQPTFGPFDDIPGVEFADDIDVDAPPVEGDLGAGEDAEVLFGDPTGIQRPGTVTDAYGPIPSDVVRRLPLMRELAMRPDAPPSLRALYQLLVDRLEQELRA